jgi:hypothetical protein
MNLWRTGSLVQKRTQFYFSTLWIMILDQCQSQAVARSGRAGIEREGGAEGGSRTLWIPSLTISSA